MQGTLFSITTMLTPACIPSRGPTFKVPVSTFRAPLQPGRMALLGRSDGGQKLSSIDGMVEPRKGQQTLSRVSVYSSQPHNDGSEGCCCDGQSHQSTQCGHQAWRPEPFHG
eukprot:4644743-Amphidinium_carterae.1